MHAFASLLSSRPEARPSGRAEAEGPNSSCFPRTKSRSLDSRYPPAARSCLPLYRGPKQPTESQALNGLRIAIRPSPAVP
jgi:hypothetical protein